MKPNTRKILEECIETGLLAGWERAHKHTDDPDDHHILTTLEQYVWIEIYERFDFGDPESVADVGWK